MQFRGFGMQKTFSPSSSWTMQTAPAQHSNTWSNPSRWIVLAYPLHDNTHLIKPMLQHTYVNDLPIHTITHTLYSDFHLFTQITKYVKLKFFWHDNKVKLKCTCWWLSCEHYFTGVTFIYFSIKLLIYLLKLYDPLKYSTPLPDYMASHAKIQLSSSTTLEKLFYFVITLNPINLHINCWSNSVMELYFKYLSS